MPNNHTKVMLEILVGFYVTGVVNKAEADLTTISKGVHEFYECARHRSVYVYISVKGSRVCKHCNVLNLHTC